MSHQREFEQRVNEALTEHAGASAAARRRVIRERASGRGPGRPPVGPRGELRLPEDLRHRVTAWAMAHRIGYPEAARQLLEIALTAAPLPYGRAQCHYCPRVVGLRRSSDSSPHPGSLYPHKTPDGTWCMGGEAMPCLRTECTEHPHPQPNQKDET